MSDEGKPNIADTPPQDIPVPPGRKPDEVKEVEVELASPSGSKDTLSDPPGRSRPQHLLEKTMIWPNEFLESSITSFVDTDFPRVKTDDPAADAAKKLDANHPVVFIVDTDERLKGILTKSDLIKLPSLPPEAKAKDLGTMVNVVAIFNSAQLWQLLKIMNGANKTGRPIDNLPVVDTDKKPVGWISRDTLRESLPQKIGAYQR